MVIRKEDFCDLIILYKVLFSSVASISCGKSELNRSLKNHASDCYINFILRVTQEDAIWNTLSR